MEKTYHIQLTSGVHTLEIAPDAPCRLIAGGLIGFDSTTLDVKVRSYAARDGGYPERRRFAERELCVMFEIDADETETEAIRRKILTMMNPAVTCELAVEMYGAKRTIPVIPCGEAGFARETMYDRPEVSLEFIAPDVFFRDAEAVEIPFRDPVALLTAPFTFYQGAGMTTGIFRTTSSAHLTNEGDADCGIVVEIQADGGSVVTPGISSGDAFIKCPVTLADGDTLVIDTRERLKNIYLNGERYFSFDRQSKFFSLPAGENTVTVTCTSGEEYIRAKISYVPLYFGL